MQVTEEFVRLVESIGVGFFGTIELSIQNDHISVVKITQTHKLPSRRDNRGDYHGGHPGSR